MKIVGITLFAILLVWMLVYSLELDSVTENIHTMVDGASFDVKISKDDELKINVYHFERVDLKTLDYIFSEIELKNRPGNRLDIILFNNDKDALIIMDPFVSHKVGDIRADYYKKTLSFGMKEDMMVKTLKKIIVDAEDIFCKVSKFEIVAFKIVNKIRPRPPRFENVTDFINTLEDIEKNIK